MIQERLKEEDCNAGAIFDCLDSIHWPNVKFVLESICDAVPMQNVQVLLFQLQKEQIQDQEFEVCTNYRYMRRKEEQMNLLLKKDEQTLALENTDNKKKTQKKAPVVKGLKKGKDHKAEEPQKS